MTTYKKALKAALVAAAVALAAEPAAAIDYMTLNIARGDIAKVQTQIDQLSKELKALRRREIRLTTECTDTGCVLKEAASYSSHEACQKSIENPKLSVCAPLTAAAQDDVPTGQ